MDSSTTTDSTPVATEPRRIGPGCLVWTARIPAIACLVVLAASVLESVWHGPVAPGEAAVIGVVAAAGTLGFVYYGALIETEFSRARALREMPRVFVQDVLLLAVFGFLALLSQTGGHDSGGGGGGGGRSAGRRSNFASGLIDPVEFAGILGTEKVEVRAEGFDGPMGSLAGVVGMDARGRRRVRLWIHVYQERAAENRWARAIRSAQPVAGPGDAAVTSGDRFTFKRGDTVVELRLLKKEDDMPVPDLATLAASVNKRLEP